MAFLLAPLTPMSVYVFSSVMGVLWLSTVPPTNAVVAQIFGVQYLSMLGGFVFFSHQIGSFLGVWLGGKLYDTTGSYDIVWYIAIALGVFAALPLVQEGGRLAVVLVTSRDTGRWVLPKGWAEPGVNRAEMAATEAFEEAGLIGEVEPRSCGSYRYAKRLDGTRTLLCEVKVFTLRITGMLDDWPEKAERQRRIISLAEAADLVEEAELAALLRRLDRLDPSYKD